MDNYNNSPRQFYAEKAATAVCYCDVCHSDKTAGGQYITALNSYVLPDGRAVCAWCLANMEEENIT